MTAAALEIDLCWRLTNFGRHRTEFRCPADGSIHPPPSLCSWIIGPLSFRKLFFWSATPPPLFGCFFVVRVIDQSFENVKVPFFITISLLQRVNFVFDKLKNVDISKNPRALRLCTRARKFSKFFERLYLVRFLPPPALSEFSKRESWFRVFREFERIATCKSGESIIRGMGGGCNFWNRSNDKASKIISHPSLLSFLTHFNSAMYQYSENSSDGGSNEIKFNS